MRNLTGFKIQVGKKKYDYRLGKNLNLKKAAVFFAQKYKITKIWSGQRHIVGILKKDNRQYFLKLATSKGISFLTENEYQWNKYFNDEISRRQSRFWVPQNYDCGYYQKKLFYLITDQFNGKLLADRPEKQKTDLIEKNVDSIIELTQLISKLKSRRTDDKKENKNFQQKFLLKTKLWYENIPENIIQKYSIEELLNFVKNNYQTLNQKPRHGDFAPWHLFLLENGNLGLIDGEHAIKNGVETYDLAFFIQRVFSELKNPDLAKKILSKAQKTYDLKKVQVVLAARAIGGFLDESLSPSLDYQYAQDFKEWILNL